MNTIRPPKYMTNGHEKEKFINDVRLKLYPPDLKKRWRDSDIQIQRLETDTVLTIKGHEVMSSYQKPYMKRLAEIVTSNGGRVLNIGHGLGIVDGFIRDLSEENNVKEHHIIELNERIALMAKENFPEAHIMNDSWEDALSKFEIGFFDGIIYDGYPLSVNEIHRDGIIFLEKLSKHNILKKGGVMTFYVDAASEVSEEFIGFLRNIGFKGIAFEKVDIEAPDRDRQHWHYDHFIAPKLIF